MAIEPRTPVLVGAAAAGQRLDEPGAGLDCTGLIIEAARGAVADAGAPGIGSKVGWIGATRGLSWLPDVGRRVSEALGADAHTVAVDVGIPQQRLFNMAFEAIRSGATDIAMMCGGEAKYRDDIARRAGIELEGHGQDGLVPDETVSLEGEIIARPEIDIGAVQPVLQYAMIDSARRPVHGWTLDEHRDDIAEIWHGFNEVAQTNPRAAFPAPMTVAEIREPGPTNRPIAFPYNKWHNSQWSVDQAAALVVVAAEVAEKLGIDRTRWVFPHVAIESSMSLSLSRRAELARWPAMGVLGRAAEDHVGRPIAEMEFIELYSCFPAAVRVQQDELGIAPSRVPTVTGGMAFAGGPFNNFVYQATVEVVERLRVEPGAYGAVSVVSGLLTKPGLTIWSTAAPPNGLLTRDLAAEAEAITAVASLDESPDDEGTVATYTVVYADDEPARVCAIVDLDSGARAVAAVDDAMLARSATQTEFIGTRVRVTGRELRV